ncbi:MAG: (d)CMP kinase [Dehalococcoidia bacterium]|nr:(d)CMP kinase [Dehalococcoidia bacterium]
MQKETTVTDSIAIDGPGAVGKTTVGRILALRLGWLFLDTGAMYRAITLAVQQKRIDTERNESSVVLLAEESGIQLTQNGSGAPRIFLDGLDVTDAIKSAEVERQVSFVSRIGGVRSAMVKKQQEMAMRGKIIMAGRDIGTVVMPGAKLKFFLTGTSEIRADRRFKEMYAASGAQTPAEVLADLIRRDKLDSEREISPLKPAHDAILVDTTNLTLDQVVDKLFQYCRERKLASSGK